MGGSVAIDIKAAAAIAWLDEGEDEETIGGAISGLLTFALNILNCTKI